MATHQAPDTGRNAQKSAIIGPGRRQFDENRAFRKGLLKQQALYFSKIPPFVARQTTNKTNRFAPRFGRFTPAPRFSHSHPPQALR
jgi:hypothetical protein